MARSIIIEAIVGSVDDCMAARRAGANRLELNSCVGMGGLTPSVGAVTLAKAWAGIPVMAMLRPRPAGFCYSEAEFDTMLRDARALVEAGADGLVFGVLLPDGRIDRARCERLMSAVPYCRELVFHRAFDLVPDPFAALEELVSLGLRRILSKGQANSFEEGEELLLKLRDRAAGRIELVIPGVRPHNIRRIVGEDGFDQIHLGRFKDSVDTSNAARPQVFFGVDSKGRENVHEIFDEDYFREMALMARSCAAES